ncbi:hypothetical protein AX15_005478 [Amanita polypyramis BW_CC]|nr:hypothetical protein AX15_005478 [Amanita polypyramis BW_CC]
MSLSKKHKISGLSGLELDLALAQLQKLRSSGIVEEVPKSDPTPPDTFTDQLDSMITTLESRAPSGIKMKPLLGWSLIPSSSESDCNAGEPNFCSIVADSTIAENYVRILPTLNPRYGGEMIAFFAAGAKASTIAVPLEGHLPQVLLELPACAKHLGKSHIRGALTTGMKCHFIAVDLDADSNGAKYWVSELIEWKTKQSSTSRERLVEGTSDEFDPALIAGILSSWIPESFVEFNGNLWFLSSLEEVEYDDN